MKIYHFPGALLLTLAVAACHPDYWPDEPADSNALHNFDQIWGDFDAHYGMFNVKEINWDSLNAVYRPQLQENSSQEDLYQVVTEMLGHLNDAHVTLFPTDPALPRWSVDLSNGTSVPPPYDFEVVKTYLTELHEPSPYLQWGWLPGNVGYIRILDVINKLKPYEKGLDEALAAFVQAKGVIVDVRGCPGGFDPNMQYVAGRFADSRELYMTVRRRNGPGHNDFTPMEYWYVEPTGERQYTGPIVLMTSRLTQSVGETFTLAMRALPNVTQLGDTTSGAFSDNIMRESWNGWLYTISIGDYRAADGASYEGKGIPPHIVVQNKREDVLTGVDEALERALQQLQ